MQQIYAVKQTDRKVVHIEINEPSRPPTANTQSRIKPTSRMTGNPFDKKITRSTIYVLNDQNNCSSMSLNTMHRETDRSHQMKKRKTSAQTCYNGFNKSAIYAQIFTQPIGKTNRRESKDSQRRSYSQANQLYDKIKIFNQNLITKQYHVEHKNLQLPNKMRTINSRNCSSSNTQEGRTETHKKQPIELRVKPKPWQVKKKGFYLAYTTKKLKTENEKHSFRCRIDPWEIFDRDDPQY